MMVFSSITIFALAFSGNDGDSFRGYPRNTQTTTDTVPPKKRLPRISADNEHLENNRVNLQAVEQAMREVERSMQRLKRELGKDYDNYIKDSYRKALDETGLQDMYRSRQRILADVQENIDYDMINKKFMQQQHRMLANANRQMELNRLNLERGRKQMELAMKNDVDLNMRKARVKLREAKVKLDELNNFKADLEKDGLIKQNEPFEIEIKDGDLYINNKKQKNKVSEKYKNKYPKYFEKNNEFRWKDDNQKQIRSFKIDNDELI
ncbi:MAG: hypothetical protein BGP13_14675 [Sphingobacteriales bacterium 40-81]|nr:MAG: hypothetical protein BGP13_14675 [Sphingobacteriales bacterium 40-81]